jgi:GNAT superfamily N-acetyltransferase
MADEDIRIEPVKTKDLYAFALGIIKKAKAGQFIPITKHRALAMSKNPNATPDDVALLVAYHGEELIGYFGIMSVRLQQGGESHKAQWFSTWTVSPQFLGRGVGSRLMQAALELEQDYFIVGSKPARRVCDKFGFKRLQPYEFTMIDLRLAARFNPISLMVRGIRKLFTLVGLSLDIRKADRFGANIFEKLAGSPIRSLLLKIASKRAGVGMPHFQSMQVDKVRYVKGKESPDKSQTALSRGDELVNWMLAYPWVVPPGQSESETFDYNFSDTRPEFELFAHEIIRDEYRGYVVFQFSVIGEKRVLKVLDVDLITEQDRGFVLPLALEMAKKKNADTIELSSDYVNSLKAATLGKIILNNKQRIYQVHPKSEESPLGIAWRDLQLNYVDGDMPFT